MPLAVGSSSTGRTAFPRQTSAGSTDIPPRRTSPPYPVPRPDSAAVRPLSVAVPPALALPVHHRARPGLSWGSGFECLAPDKIHRHRSPVQTRLCQCNPRQPAADSCPACEPQGEIAVPCGIGRPLMHSGKTCSRQRNMVIWHSIAAGLMVATGRKVSRQTPMITAKEVPSCNNTCA